MNKTTDLQEKFKLVAIELMDLLSVEVKSKLYSIGYDSAAGITAFGELDGKETEFQITS